MLYLVVFKLSIITIILYHFLVDENFSCYENTVLFVFTLFK